ncbi:polysaccharide biosynthesis/export family protein [Arenibaculum pallidiluteum]|uniref:polysaccharide biosynthesis/export family protein n=1 Tax=Arenibaculum pallidiluteum TaxID=2812559 RepID=UPI001A97CA23|nr:polysaccharide biosynthesis/export family protein [Arenibaculum pallidiluteum]
MSTRSFIHALVLGGLLLGLSACGNDGRDAPMLPQQASASNEYRLGPGDQVRVTVFGQEQLSGDFAVDGSGNLAMPLIGEVKAANASVRGLEQAIATKLADGYVRDPKVSVEVRTFRPFYIMGEVNRPGQYNYANGMTAAQAVALAGGYTYRGRQDYVLITRAGDKTEYRAPPSATILPDDVVRVPERYF